MRLTERDARSGAVYGSSVEAGGGIMDNVAEVIWIGKLL